MKSRSENMLSEKLKKKKRSDCYLFCMCVWWRKMAALWWPAAISEMRWRTIYAHHGFQRKKRTTLLTFGYTVVFRSRLGRLLMNAGYLVTTTFTNSNNLWSPHIGFRALWEDDRFQRMGRGAKVATQRWKEFQSTIARFQSKERGPSNFLSFQFLSVFYLFDGFPKSVKIIWQKCQI